MSKLNPQKASAYVGPGVLRKGGKVTKVPNGPLIKKKGVFKGSTLKAGGTIKKAQNGDSTKVSTLSPYMQKRAAQDLVKQKNIRARDSVLNRTANAQGRTREELRANQKKQKSQEDVARYETRTAKDDRELAKESNKTSGPGFFDSLNSLNPFKEKAGCIYTDEDKSGVKKRNGGPVKKKAKAGAMIKRADGSMSKRGLWDNIRKNKGSGKKPTKQMLVQEKKIKAKAKK